MFGNASFAVSSKKHCSSYFIFSWSRLVECSNCCNWKAQVAFAQSFTLWLQAIIEIIIMQHNQSLYYCLFMPYIYNIWVLFFTHILFMVNRTFNTMPMERLQQSYPAIIWTRLFELVTWQGYSISLDKRIVFVIYNLKAVSILPPR